MGGLGPKYYNIHGIWARMPYYLGPSTLRDCPTSYAMCELPMFTPICPEPLEVAAPPDIGFSYWLVVGYEGVYYIGVI